MEIGRGDMTVFRRYRVPLTIILVALLVLVIAVGYLQKDDHRGDLDSSIVRGGRADLFAPVVDRRDGQRLESVSGIIPSAFFVQVAQVQGDGDPPQNARVSVGPKLDSELREPERQPTTSKQDKGSSQATASPSGRSSQGQILHEVRVDSNPIYSKAVLTQASPTTLPHQDHSHDTTPLPQTEPSTHQALPLFYPSKELFVRAVHFDDRPRDGHLNTSVFLVVAIRTITDKKLIVGCQIDNHVADAFKVELIGETPLWRAFYNHINHEEAMVHCYNLPATNNSVGYISFKTSQNSTVKIAASERLVKFPAPRIAPTSEEGKRYNLTIVTCAKVFNSPPWLSEWITYQRTLGVDHIHFDAEDTFKKYGAINNPDLQAAIKSGYVTVELWKQYLNGNELWYHNQGLMYEDCAYRFRNTYDYIVMVDTDDFFTPRVPGEGKLHYYIDKYCRGKTTGSCKFKWIEFFPDHYGLNNATVNDGNITRRLANYSHYNQGNPKSLHRTNVVLDAATHYAYKMVVGYHIEQVPPNVAYFAHIRKKKGPPSKGLKIGLPRSSACLEHVLSRSLLFFVLALCILFCA